MDNASDPADAGHAPSERDLRGACEDLLRSWDETYLGAEELALGREDQQPDAVRFLFAVAFAAHAHHLTGTACSLLHDGDYASAVPLIRVAYESALTAVWAAESEDAARALHNQYISDIEKLRSSVRQTGWFDDLLDRLPEPGVTVEVTPRTNGEAGNFANLCQSLEPHSA